MYGDTDSDPGYRRRDKVIRPRHLINHDPLAIVQAWKFTILKPFYISIGEALARHETWGQGGRQETRNMSEQWTTLCYTSSHHSSSLNFTTMTTLPTKRWECPANSWSLDISPPLPFSLSLSSACVCLGSDWAEAYSLCHLPGLGHTALEE